MVREAEGRLATLRAAHAGRAALVDDVVVRLRAEVAEELATLASADDTHVTSRRLEARGALDATSLGMPARRIPEENGLGKIDAASNPLVDYREGRVLPQGATVAAEALLELRAARSLLLLFQPSVALSQESGGDSQARASVQRGYLRLAARNLVVELGRDHLQWGQGRDAALLTSSGAPALDMILLSHERPVVLPWLLRFAGPTRWSIFLSRLDGGQNFPHPYLVGYKASALPARWLELGASIYTKGGGSGGPGATFGERLADATALIDVLFRGESDYQFSDKYAGGELRLRVPRAAGLELYGEMLLNDLDFNRFASSVGEDAAHVAGLWLPRLDGVGRVDGRIELRHTGIRQYRHHQFTSGQVLRGRLLGDPLGPDAMGAYLALGWEPSLRHRLALDLAAEERSADEYVDVTNGAATIDFERSVAHPHERRARAVLGWEGARRGGAVRLLAQLGIERASNFGFVDRVSRTGGLARIGLTFGPSWEAR